LRRHQHISTGGSLARGECARTFGKPAWGATMAAEAEIEAAPRWQDELYDLLRANDE